MSSAEMELRSRGPLDLGSFAVVLYPDGAWILSLWDPTDAGFISDRDGHAAHGTRVCSTCSRNDSESRGWQVPYSREPCRCSAVAVGVVEADRHLAGDGSNFGNYSCCPCLWSCSGHFS